MNEVQRVFLTIIQYGLQGRQLTEPTGLSTEQWNELADLSREHRLLPVVYQTVYRLPELQGTEFLGSLQRRSKQHVLLQTRRHFEFLDLLTRIREAGVRPLVVKGIICRSLYPYPEQRVSADEDVLIPREQFALCHRVLTEWGMYAAMDPKQMAAACEVPYRRRGSSLYIELHTSLFPPESKAYGDLNRFFEGVFDRVETASVDGAEVPTLGCTDHLFYLIVHAFKHFLHSGFGLRQVCDIILYANRWGSRVDWEQILDNCREIRADRFAAALFRIGRDYLVFDPDEACFPALWRGVEADPGPLLEDLLASGIYGSASSGRLHSSRMTLNAVAAQKRGRKSKGGLAASLFPPARTMEGNYPYLRRRPWLIPVAWADRILRYGAESAASGKEDPSEALKIGNRRIDLLRQYGVIE